MSESLAEDAANFEVVAAMSRALINQRGCRAPHEDDRVLHAPGECFYCDGFPDWQESRRVQQINFTGCQDTGRAACPSETVRHPRYETIERFHDSSPAPHGGILGDVDVEVRWLRP